MIYKIKDEKKEFLLILGCILFCNICTFVTEHTFIIPLNPFENKIHIIKINDMNIPDNSVVLAGTMKSAFIAPAQNKNVKYLGYILPDNYAKQTIWADNLFNNKLYKNKYLENEIKKLLLSDTKTFIIFNLEQIQDDFDLYNQSIKEYSDNKKHLDNCKMIEYKIFGYINLPDRYQICEII
jgi:hypothetical protein